MLKYVQKETKGNSERRRWWTERTGTSPRLGSGVVRSQKQPQQGKYQWLRRFVYCAQVLMVSQYNKWMLGSLISKHQESLKLLSGGVSGPIRHGFYSFQISLHLPTLKHEAKERYCSYMKLTFFCFHIRSLRNPGVHH